MKNHCLNRLRRQKYHHSHLEYVKKSREEYSADITKKIITTEVMIELRRAIDRLPRKYRRVVNEVYFTGRRVKVIATELGLPQSTLKSQKAKALKMLREDLN